jgi:hypothetical protein
MAQTIDFYRERAREAAEEASNATLENVRERARRSEAAWRQMADRALAVEENRARRATEVEQAREAADIEQARQAEVEQSRLAAEVEQAEQLG